MCRISESLCDFQQQQVVSIFMFDNSQNGAAVGFFLFGRCVRLPQNCLHNSHAMPEHVCRSSTMDKPVSKDSKAMGLWDRFFLQKVQVWSRQLAVCFVCLVVGVALPDSNDLYRAAAISFKYFAGFGVHSLVGSESCTTCHSKSNLRCVSMTGLHSIERFGDSTFQGLPFAESDIDGNIMTAGPYNQASPKNAMPETTLVGRTTQKS